MPRTSRLPQSRTHSCREHWKPRLTLRFASRACRAACRSCSRQILRRMSNEQGSGPVPDASTEPQPASRASSGRSHSGTCIRGVPSFRCGESKGTGPVQDDTVRQRPCRREWQGRKGHPRDIAAALSPQHTRRQPRGQGSGPAMRKNATLVHDGRMFDALRLSNIKSLPPKKSCQLL